MGSGVGESFNDAGGVEEEMKTRNPIAKAVRNIRPKIVPGKEYIPEVDIDELHEYASQQLDKNTKKK